MKSSDSRATTRPATAPRAVDQRAAAVAGLDRGGEAEEAAVVVDPGQRADVAAGQVAARCRRCCSTETPRRARAGRAGSRPSASDSQCRTGAGRRQRRHVEVGVGGDQRELAAVGEGDAGAARHHVLRPSPWSGRRGRTRSRCWRSPRRSAAAPPRGTGTGAAARAVRLGRGRPRSRRQARSSRPPSGRSQGSGRPGGRCRPRGSARPPGRRSPARKTVAQPAPVRSERVWNLRPSFSTPLGHEQVVAAAAS